MSVLAVKDIVLVAGDYLEVFIFQNSVGGLLTQAGDTLTYASLRMVAKT